MKKSCKKEQCKGNGRRKRKAGASPRALASSPSACPTWHDFATGAAAQALVDCSERIVDDSACTTRMESARRAIGQHHPCTSTTGRRGRTLSVRPMLVDDSERTTGDKANGDCCTPGMSTRTGGRRATHVSPSPKGKKKRITPTLSTPKAILPLAAPSTYLTPSREEGMNVDFGVVARTRDASGKEKGRKRGETGTKNEGKKRTGISLADHVDDVIVVHAGDEDVAGRVDEPTKLLEADSYEIGDVKEAEI
ncbi:hypothetical protein B0H19DRAFT_1075924 [Mycena capillaripes]|nr:hypothetical protein B0H19DRAFT_1075924 [Mycena capillaripes]